MMSKKAVKITCLVVAGIMVLTLVAGGISMFAAI